VPRTRDVVELVNEVPVTPPGIQVQCQLPGSNERHSQSRAQEPPRVLSFGFDVVHWHIVYGDVVAAVVTVTVSPRLQLLRGAG